MLYFLSSPGDSDVCHGKRSLCSTQACMQSHSLIHSFIKYMYTTMCQAKGLLVLGL